MRHLSDLEFKKIGLRIQRKPEGQLHVWTEYCYTIVLSLLALKQMIAGRE